MIVGIICKCKICNKEFVVNIEDPEIDDINIINKWDCPCCKEAQTPANLDRLYDRENKNGENKCQ